MAGYHGITGWSGGGRRPLTYNLMPGQMRSTRVNIFPSIMPMATCYYAEPPLCDCNHGSGIPKWMQWTMGIGMFSQLAGGILGAIFDSSSDGAGGAAKKDIDAENDLAQIQSSFKKAGYTISKYSDGTCEARDKNGKLVASAKTPMLLKAELDKLQETDNTETPKVNHTHNKDLLNTLASKEPTLASKITYDDESGKFKVGEKEFEDFSEAVREAKNPSSTTAAPAAPAAATAAAPTDTDWKKTFNAITQLQDKNLNPLNIPQGATTTYSGKGSEVNAPKEIEIKDSNGAVLYKFELFDEQGKTDNKVNPKYTCVKMGSTDLVAGRTQQEYFLKNDGTMYQNNNTIGFGTALGKVVKQPQGGGGKTRSLSQYSGVTEAKANNYDNNVADEQGMKTLAQIYRQAKISYDKFQNKYSARFSQAFQNGTSGYKVIEANSIEELKALMEKANLPKWKNPTN